MVKQNQSQEFDEFIAVSHSSLQASSDVFLKVLAGDEVIQVNDQIVVSTAVRPQTCIVFTFLFENACFPDLGGVEQSKPYKEAAGESQQSHSGPEEDLRVSPTHQSAPGFIHTGQTALIPSLSHLVI